MSEEPKVLPVEPVYVLHVPHAISAREAERVRAYLEERMSGVKLIIIDGGARLTPLYGDLDAAAKRAKKAARPYGDPWDQVSETTREMWRKVARAVLDV